MHFTLATFFVSLAALTTAAPQPVGHVGQRIGVAVPITKRSRLVNADKSVDISALSSHVASTKAKLLRGFDNFEKNTGAPHPSAVKETEKRATGTISLTDDSSELWYGTVSVGDPSNSFTVDFDTGSSDFFLPGPDCTSNCAGHTIYDPSKSKTAHDLGNTFSDSYGVEGETTVAGEQYTDTVTLAGLTAENQVFGVATEYSSNFEKAHFSPDGLMGMAFPLLAAFTPSPIFQTLITQKQTNEPVFSFKLSASGAELYLGGANSALHTGDFTYTPVTVPAYWEVNIDNIQGNGQTILTNVDSIIDTGTTLVVGDSSQVASLYKALGGTDASSTAGPGFYTFPCNSFPSISFTFGGESFPISADILNLGTLSPGSSDCVSGITGANTGGLWIVGDVFLRNVYTTFDVGNLQVGFAQLA